jgi:hypothetical protein
LFSEYTSFSFSLLSLIYKGGRVIVLNRSFDVKVNLLVDGLITTGCFKSFTSFILGSFFSGIPKF